MSKLRETIERFPRDFMFQVTEKEKYELVANCDWLEKLKHSNSNPYVFTEQGVYMLSSILKTKKAVEINIAIIRTFKKLRELSKHYNVLAKKIMDVEKKSDKQYKELLQLLDSIFEASKEIESKTIGFIKDKS